MMAFSPRPLLTLALFTAFGCDNTSAGQTNEPNEPPALTRVVAMPTMRACKRCAITDLLDTAPAPACAVDSPCPVPFQVNAKPVMSCVTPMGATSGTCVDLLAAGPVGIGSPDDGNTIRLVFSKPLDPNLNDLTMDAMGNAITTLKSGILEVDDPSGMALKGTAFYDPTGSAITSDAIAEPFGPALEIDLAAPLAPATQYTIKLDSSRVADRKGQGPTDAAGANRLPAPYTLTFTTEKALMLFAAAPDITSSKTVVKPDDVIQLQFRSPVADPNAAGSTAMITLTDAGGKAVKIESWIDEGAPKTCKGNPSQIDIVAITGPGMATPLAAGTYTLSVTGLTDATGKSDPYSNTFMFTVGGMPDPKDVNAVANFYVPGGACK